MKYLYLFTILVFLACWQPKKEAAQEETDFCSKIHRNDSVSLSDELKDIQDSMENKTGVYVLEDGGGALITRAWLSEYAENTIDIQYFIFSTDNVGLIGCDYLVRAADRGVQVRIIVDDLMVDAEIDDILTLDSHKNISIKIYNPGVNLGKNIIAKVKKLAVDFRGANQRMHNKTFIVDKKIVITGGRNLADEYYDYDHEYNFRDRDVLLIGKISKKVNASFEDFWNSSYCIPVTQLAGREAFGTNDEHRFDKLHQYACNPENFWPQIRTKIENFQAAIQNVKKSGDLVWLDSVEFVSDLPGKNKGTEDLAGGGICTDALINLVKNARRSIDIQSPYLITSKLGYELFADAVKRGVKVRILTNSLASTDNLEAFSGYQRNREALLKTGMEIYEFRPDADERFKVMTGDLQKTIGFKPVFGLHAKSMVIDGNITVIGTFNLDPRSANLNTECVAIMHSTRIAHNVLENMEVDYKPENSWKTTLEWNPDSKVSRAKRAKTMIRKVIPKDIL